MRFQNYKQQHCWQYDIRLNNLETDLTQAGLTKAEADNLRTTDLEFRYVGKEDKEKCLEIKEFIERHEWLGKLPNRPTHRFIAEYKGKLAGVIIMATPNSFSHLLGRENKDLEKLISRGACISWSPKNLGSALVMFSVRWMVENTDFRYFTAYSDTEAKELGTIYQSCNFIYLGKKSGGRFEFFDPEHPDKGWFSDRIFRRLHEYKKYALALGIEWQRSWHKGFSVVWKNIPDEVEQRLRAAAWARQSRCKKRKLPLKHKYVCIVGNNKRETRRLRSLFYKFNPKYSPRENNGRLTGYEYPKQRGQ